MEIKAIIALLLAVLLIIFIVQNSAPIEVKLYFWRAQISQALVVFLSLLVGLLVGLLVRLKRR